MSAARACPRPLSSDVLVAYWAGDLAAAESDAVDDHVFGCATCTALSERIAAVTEKLRTLEPAIITPERLAELRAAGRRIEDNVMAPGQRTKVVFGPQELIVHHLGGLELSGVERVHVVVRVDASDHVLIEYAAAPFDARAGEVLVACQRHFIVFPPNVSFEVTTFARGEPKKITRYAVEHEFVGA